MKRLVLIDGHAILHRAYHALPPLTTSAGELVNAVYGFTTMLLRVIDELKPNYLIVAFDTPKPTFRHAEYVGYQAQRPKMEDELAGQIEKVQRIVRALGIPIFAVEGYEADDVIGTLAKRAAKKKIEVVIATGDRDMFQLVQKEIKIYAPVKGMSEARIFDYQAVEEKMGVKPEQIVDYKSLVGDPSDNYPGVPGIGPKTAAQLLHQYQTLDNLYKHLGKLPEVQTQKLVEGKESAELSRKLARIMVDVPIELDLEKAQFVLTDEEKARAIEEFKALGFRSLVARMGGEKKSKLKSKSKKEDSQPKLF